MMIHVEVEFTIRHTVDELRDTFIQRGNLPDWRLKKLHMKDGSALPTFLETRLIGIDLRNEQERHDWFVFSFEACGELRKRISIPNIVSSSLNLDDLMLDDFLRLCRECLVAPPTMPGSDMPIDITEEHIGLRKLLKRMLN